MTDQAPKPGEDSKTNDANSSNPFVVLARYSEIGFILPAAVVVGYLIGLALDHWLHTQWIYLAGLIFGAIVGFVKMIQRALSSSNEGK